MTSIGHKAMSVNTLRLVGICSVLIVAVILGPTGCTKSPTTKSDKIHVVCTTGPVADILRNLGGDRLEVIGLMGPGVDPHLYRASTSDIERLHDADMIFYNGLHLEGRMADMFETMARRKPTFAVTQSLVEGNHPKLRKPPEFEGYYDPHVWHDPKLWAECVRYVAKVLSEQDPSHAEDYQKRADNYVRQLDEVDAYCRKQLQTIPKEQRALVTVHDAFNYFCAAYGLESMPLKGVSTEDEVTIGRKHEVVEFLITRKIKAVFVESAAAPQVIESLIEPCREEGHEVKIGPSKGKEFVLYADALGPKGSGADNYVGMIKANVKTIVSALK
jgi:manganese/zinc/iron transport system substrate-binding protein